MPSLDELSAYYRAQYRAGTDEFGSSPYEDPADVNFRTLSQVDYVRQLGLEPRSVVDVGCGFGLLLNGLRQLFPNARFSGIELSEKCYPALKGLGINLVRSPLERETGNPFQEQFDLLVCSHVLEHSCDLRKFLSACHGMVRPGGTALFEVPNCEYDYGSDVPHVVFFTPKTLKWVLEQSRFTVMRCQTCGPSIERWLPGAGQQLRNFVDEYFPQSTARILKAGWRLARTKKKANEASVRAMAHGLIKLREEAKDRAWFQYEMPGVRHSAIRCVAVRND